MVLKEDPLSFNTGRVEHIYADPHEKANFRMHFGDFNRCFQFN